MPLMFFSKIFQRASLIDLDLTPYNKAVYSSRDSKRSSDKFGSDPKLVKQTSNYSYFLILVCLSPEFASDGWYSFLETLPCA